MKTRFLVVFAGLVLAFGIGFHFGRTWPAPPPAHAAAAPAETIVLSDEPAAPGGTLSTPVVRMTRPDATPAKSVAAPATATAPAAPTVPVARTVSGPNPAGSIPPPIAVQAANPLAAVATTRFDSKPGSEVRIEGTSTMHDWQVQGRLIGGFLELPAWAPAGITVTGQIPARVEAFIPVRSLASVKKDGSPYSTAMDDIMYGKLLATKFQRIAFRLSELSVTNLPASPSEPWTMLAKGELGVAGVTNLVSFPVTVLSVGPDQLKISGQLDAKMTDFRITPPAPGVANITIKTGDEVKLSFEWIVARKELAMSSGQ